MEKNLRREAFVCDELPPRPRVCRYQLGRLRRLLIRTGAEEISWALGAAFLKGPSTRKDGADMWRRGNAPSLAPSCGYQYISKHESFYVPFYWTIKKY